MSRYIIHLAYNGAAYSGWQTQPGLPTVQQTLEQALGIKGTGTCHTPALRDKMDIFNVKRGGHELLTSLVQFKGVRRRCQSAEPTAHQAAPFFR